MPPTRMSDRLFTGREKERRFFVSMLEGRKPARVLVITGMGGIGKTELLKQFQRLAGQRGIPWARVDGTAAEDVPRILDEVARQLASQGLELGPLTGSLREYARVKARLPAPSRAVLTSVAEAIGGAARAVPMVPAEVAEAVQKVSGQVAGTIYDVLKRTDVELYLDAQRFLTDQFLLALDKADRPLVLFFDAYEKMLGLDAWVRELATQVGGRGVWLVIAGQIQLSSRWSNVSGVHQFTLNSLTDREARRFLRRKGLSDPALIEDIASFSHCVPLALHLAADLALKYDIRDFGSASQKQEIVDQLLERTALVAAAQDTQVLLACAIPRALNVPLVARLLPDRDAAAVMADLRTRPYVVFAPAGLALHDSVREFACAKLKFENRPLFERLHRAAIEYYDEQLGLLSEGCRELSADWHRQAQERLYHTLHLDEEQGYRYFNTLYWQIDGQFQFAECLNLASAFLRFPFSDERLVRWGCWHKAHALFDLNRWVEAKALYLRVLEEETDPTWRSYTLNELGKTATMLNQWHAARDYLEEAIRLKRQLSDEYGLGVALTRLADVHAWLHTEQGYKEIRLFREALGIFERLGHKYRQAEVNYCLSWSHRSVGRWDEAEQYALAALALCEEAEQGEYRALYQRGRTLDVLAHSHRHRGLFKTAEGYAREAVASFRRLDHEYRLADALQGLAHVAILRGNLGEARACLEEALDIATGMDDKFTVAIVEKTFGQICLRQGRLDEAQAAFEGYLRAMTDVGQELRVAMAHHHLGEVFQRRGDWAEAKAHLRAANRCIYGQTSAAFRAVETLRLFGLVAVGEGHRSGGCQLLRFALRQAELHELLHVQAWTHLSLAQTLLDGPGSDRQAVERHLDAASALAAEQEYRDVAHQAARLREALQVQ